MSWKIWTSLVVIALVGGFYFGYSKRGAKEAAKAVAAEKQVEQLGQTIKAEISNKQNQAQEASTAQTRADLAEGKVQMLTKRLKDQESAIPATGPVTISAPEVAVDKTKDDLIAAQSQEITELKTVNLKLNLEVATDNQIISNQQKQLDLERIALSAQVAANKAAHSKGILEGGGTVAVIAVAVHLITHI